MVEFSVRGAFSPLLLWQTSNWVPTDRISACLFHLHVGLTFLKEVASSGNLQLLDPYELWDTVKYIWLLNDPYWYRALLFVFRKTLDFLWASLVAQLVKNPSAMQETGFDPWVRKVPWSRKWQPTSVFLPWEIPWTEEHLWTSLH